MKKDKVRDKAGDKSTDKSKVDPADIKDLKVIGKEEGIDITQILKDWTSEQLFELVQKIKEFKRNMQYTGLMLGKMLFLVISNWVIIKDKIGYDTFEEFCIGEIDLSKQTAYQLIRIYRKYILELRLDEEEVSWIPYYKLDMLIKQITDKNKDDIIEDLKILGPIDLVKKYYPEKSGSVGGKIKKTGEKGVDIKFDDEKVKEDTELKEGGKDKGKEEDVKVEVKICPFYNCEKDYCSKIKRPINILKETDIKIMDDDMVGDEEEGWDK